MPVIAKFSGIVIRLLCLRGLGGRLHAFCGDQELVLNLRPLQVVQGNVSAATCRLVLAWAREHHLELMAALARLEHGRTPLPIGM